MLSKFFNVRMSKMLKSLGIGMAGAALTYAVQYFSGQDFGELTPVVTGLLAWFANYLKEVVETPAA
jgi:hypothetical protein